MTEIKTITEHKQELISRQYAAIKKFYKQAGPSQKQAIEDGFLYLMRFVTEQTDKHYWS